MMSEQSNFAVDDGGSGSPPRPEMEGVMEALLYACAASASPGASQPAAPHLQNMGNVQVAEGESPGVADFSGVRCHECGEDTDLPAHRDNNKQCFGPTCYDDNTGLHFGTANNCCRQCLVDVYGYEWRAATGDDEPDWLCKRCQGAPALPPGGECSSPPNGNNAVRRKLATDTSAVGVAADGNDSSGAKAKKARLEGPEALPAHALAPEHAMSAPAPAPEPAPALALVPAAPAPEPEPMPDDVHSALRAAAANGDVAALEAVLASHAASRVPIRLSAPDSDTGSTALHLACRGGHVDMAAWLLAFHASATATDKRQRTPLHLAAAAPANSGTLVQMLLARLPASAKEVRDGKGMTPLLRTAVHGNADAAAVLLDAGVCVDELHEPTGSTPLHIAAAMGQPAVVSLLLARGAAVDPRNGNNQTPLACALTGKAKKEEVQAMCAALVGAGAQLLVPSGCEDKGVLELFLERSSIQPPAPEVVATAITHGVDRAVTDAVAEQATEAARLASEASAAQQELAQVKGELATCRAELARARAAATSYTALQQELAAVNGELAAARAAAEKHAAVRQARARLREELAACKAQLAAAKENAADLARGVSALTQQVNDEKAACNKERSQRLEAVSSHQAKTRELRAENERLKARVAAQQRSPGSAQRAPPQVVSSDLWPALERELQPQLLAAKHKSADKRKALKMQLSLTWHPDRERTGSLAMRALFTQAMQLINSELGGP